MAYHGGIMNDDERRVRMRRVYDAPQSEDGQRVLVDRLWPRGLTRQRAQLDAWCTEIAPSKELRVWYGHEPERFEEFARRYREELAAPDRETALAHLRAMAAGGPLTLLTATKQLDLSDAAVLVEVLRTHGDNEAATDLGANRT